MNTEVKNKNDFLSSYGKKSTEEYKQEKAQERTDFTAAINDRLKAISDNPDILHGILQKAAVFPERGITNVIAIAEKKPYATDMRTLNEWKKAGVKVNIQDDIKLWTAGETNYDETTRKTNKYVNLENQYDIRDTNIKNIRPAPKQNPKLCLLALKDTCPLIWDKTIPYDAVYVPSIRGIAINDSLKGKTIPTLMAITRELAHRKMFFESRNANTDYVRGEQDEFVAKCTAYTVAARCGIDVSKIGFEKSDIPNLNTDDMKKALDNSKNYAGDIYKEMEVSLIKSVPEKETVKE